MKFSLQVCCVGKRMFLKYLFLILNMGKNCTSLNQLDLIWSTKSTLHDRLINRAFFFVSRSCFMNEFSKLVLKKMIILSKKIF